MAGTTFDPITSAQVLAVDAKVQAVQTAVANISKGIKSVQRGATVAGAIANVTISSVVPSKTFVNMNSVNVDGGLAKIYAALTSPTNLRVGGTTSSGASDVYWEVVEWY